MCVLYSLHIHVPRRAEVSAGFHTNKNSPAVLYSPGTCPNPSQPSIVGAQGSSFKAVKEFRVLGLPRQVSMGTSWRERTRTEF